jgi:exopolysaccharide biosynthesis polyprenyl glycosylphosphotransferase
MHATTNRFHDLTLKITTTANYLLMGIPFVIGWMCYYAPRTYAPYHGKGNYLIIALFLILYVIYTHIYDALLVPLCRISEMIYSQGLSAFIADAIMYIVFWLLTKHLPALWPLLLVFATQLLISAMWSYIAHLWYFHQFAPKKTAIVYDMREGMENLVKEYGLDIRFDVQTNISAEQCIQGDMKDIENCEVAFLCGIHSHDRNIILKYCIAHRITVYAIPRIGDVLMGSAKNMHMFHLPIMQIKRYQPNVEYVAAKRFMDILVSGIALIVLSPVMLVTAIAIKATDKGPVFYKQCRLTKDGRTFDVLKFRSMRVDAEKDGVARLSTGSSDSRITPVGSVIRKVRIDELPQFINILKGDMSLVGPRPERPEIAAQYEKELPEFALRLQAKAGLTGYAQVYGKYNTTPYDKLQMDLMYIAKPSILEDLRIIFATVKILFLPESTDGIAEGATTAKGKFQKAETCDMKENVE